MDVSSNHLLLQIESNSFMLSIIRFWEGEGGRRGEIGGGGKRGRRGEIGDGERRGREEGGER